MSIFEKRKLNFFGSIKPKRTESLLQFNRLWAGSCSIPTLVDQDRAVFLKCAFCSLVSSWVSQNSAICHHTSKTSVVVTCNQSISQLSSVLRFSMSTSYKIVLVSKLVVLFLLIVHKTVGKFDPYADNGGTLVGESWSCLIAFL